MKISWNEQTPRKIQHFPNPDYPTDNPDLEDVLTSADVDHVAQIFQTPLTGSYNWDYSVQDDRIKKLSGGSFFPIFGPWSPEVIIFDLRFGFYAKFQPRGWILRSVDLRLTIVFWF